MMRRILTSLIAMVAILLGGVQPAATAAPVAVPATNAYDGHHHAAAPTDTATEHGPPLAYDRFAIQDAVDVLSHGASARPNLTALGPTTPYVTLTSLAAGAHAATATGRQVQAAGGNLSALRVASVAANGADDTIRVGRWMGEDEFTKMSNSGRVIEGGGGRTYVTNPANPDAYPAGKGIFAEFNVPRDSVFPASKPEWGVIPGPNIPTTRYGPPPLKMPPATCIVLVCRR